ncbi:histone H1C-like isoform X2 [Palaemon carinicauda]|uniref:histone H1C-like isoform X1 n=1 Tax=Palaemon carinicauda TaxID=392227 RepID=UPI0035B61072
MKTPKSAKKAQAAAVENVTPVKTKTPKKPKSPKKPKTPKAEVAPAEVPEETASPKAPDTPKVPKVNGSAIRKSRDRNPKAVYLFFKKDVTADTAKALVKKFNKAESFSFGRGFMVYFDDKEKAEEVKASAANQKFAGVKPEWVASAFVAPASRKRSKPDDEAENE